MRLLKEIHSLTGNYHVKSGLYHYHRAEFRQAEEFFCKALQDEETLAPAERSNARHYLTLSLMDLATKLESGGDSEAAIEQLRKASDVSPNFPDIHFRLGKLLEELERPDEAVATYRRATGAHPKYLEAHVALGFCLLRMERVDDSAAAFKQALKIKLERTKKPFRQAIDLLERGDVQEAADQFHETFLNAPVLAEEYRRKAVEWLKAEEFEKALVEFDRALSLSPKYPDMHNFRGVVLYELDRVDEAIDAFRTAAALSPQFLVPRLNLAFALIRDEAYREADVVLQAILELDPSEPAAKSKLDELRSGRLPEKRRRVSRGNSR
jgi:superkiller protein 3